MSDLYGFAYTLDETLKTMEDVISTGNHDRMFLDTYYWLKTLKEYQEIGTVEECREAREKQIPKAPIMKPYYEDMPDEEYLCCPTCGDILTDRIPDDNKNFYFHCLNCGQKFDWREEDTK